MNRRRLCFALALSLTVACAQQGPGHAAEGPPRVATSFYPLTWFAEVIGDGAVEVLAPLPADADPAFWKPEPDALQAFQAADVVLLNGAEFEKWVSKVSLPESRVVYTAAGFEEEWIHREEETHSHGGLSPHSHGAIDGHTWMDPNQAKLQARAACEAMVRRWPEEKGRFEAGLARVESALDEVDAGWRALAPKLKEAHVIASHPSYDYPARRYGFAVESFDLDPEARLDEATVKAVLESNGGGSPKIMLWESEPLEENVRALSEHGVRSVVFAPGEALGEEERAAGRDFPAIMQENLQRLEAGVE